MKKVIFNSKKELLAALREAWQRYSKTNKVDDMDYFSALEDTAYGAGCSIEEVLGAVS